MTTIQKNTHGVKIISREHAEAVLHADFEAGLFCTGDVELWPAEMWPSFTDDWRFEPTPEAILAEQEAEALAIVAEMELIAETLDDFEHEDQVYFREYYRFLDALAPLPEELEVRDCGLGHPA
jgi:hypothetical protein